VTNILLVEDSAADREFALRALRKHDLGSRVAIAEDGVIALELLHGSAALRPKVVFLDLKMPRLGGFEVLSRMRSDDRTRDVPVVALSSSAEDRDIAESYRLGANSYVVKPGDFDAFELAVSQLGKYWIHLNRAVR
jgi:CheY-like chemotaxis protein